MVAATVVLVALAGAGLYGWKSGWFVTGTPQVSHGQAAVAKDLVNSADPFAEINARIDAGGEENLNAVFGGLMTIARDPSNSAEMRQKAYVMLAEMYDPATFDAGRSPFREPDANAARRQYTSAAELGSELAKSALARLKE